MLIEAFQGRVLVDPDSFSAETIYDFWEGLESVSALAREKSFLDSTRKGAAVESSWCWGMGRKVYEEEEG